MTALLGPASATALALGLSPTGVRVALLCAVLLPLGGIGVAAVRRRELVQRWLVWLVAAPVALAAATVPHAMTVLVLAIAVVAGGETARLVGSRWALVAAVTPPLLAACRPLPVWVVVGLALLTLPLVRSRRPWAVALALVGLPLAVMADADPDLVLAAMVAVSVADVAAYLAGHALGKRGPLAAPISAWSPNKTRAGLVGSLVAGAAVLAVLGAWVLVPLVPVWGVLGDLRESRVKRLAGVKDAGSWLPGFGGLLDRVDSVLGAMVGLALTQGVVLAVAR